ncbi:MAG: 4-hydroxy-tetrahydrodipicolinate synthase [Oscillospiraceae bacterium]|nr:4-hydroxy-tetrahydrodipicolinate synthase [Oscillospiraceae bacterium]
MKTPIFKGSCTAIVTPFCDEGIDYERLEKNLEFQYENGTAAVVVCGTTGENSTINAVEYETLIRRTVLLCRGRMKVVVGVGGNNTAAVLSKAQSAKAVGADGILMVTPYYNKTTQKGLIEHFSYVADRVEIPMILYNVPSRTGIGIKAETYKILSEHPNIVGTKEASGDFSLIAAARSLCGDELFFWSGNDDNTVPMMTLGALGVISVASNIVPGVVAKLCEHCLNGDYAAATALFCKYRGFFSALFLETNPIPVKAAMKLLGYDSGLLRLPLTDIGEPALQKLRAEMRVVGLNV